MSQEMNDLKPMFLSEEEAMVLLDLCMMSDAEFDQHKLAVLLKRSDLVREHLVARVAATGEVGRSGRDDLRAETNGDVPDAILPEDRVRILLAGTDSVAGFRQPSYRPVLKPCPAGRFRSWTTTSGL